MISKQFIYILLFVGFHNIVICSEGQGEEKCGESNFRNAYAVAINFESKTKEAMKASLHENVSQVNLGGFRLKYEKNRFSFFKINCSDPLLQGRARRLVSSSLRGENKEEVVGDFLYFASQDKVQSDDLSRCIHIEDPRYDGLTGWNDWLRSYGFSLPWTVPARKLENDPNFNVKIPIVIQDSFDNSSSNKTSRYSYSTLKIARDLHSIGFKNVQLEKLPATNEQSNRRSQNSSNSTFQPEMSFFKKALKEDEENFTAKKARNGMFIIPGILLAASFMMGGK